ncbi:MAG: M23 family metallopeptidase [Spirochaetota bacterium]|nr:M23 family metallopeptidase [Spirochaetota bacterium]
MSRIAAKAVSFIAENVKKVIDLGKQRFTVMLIPHSERKIFNFRISVFSLIFVGLLLAGVLAAFFTFSTKFSGVSNLLTRNQMHLEDTRANLELIRDEIVDLRQVSREFEKSLISTLESFGVMDAGQDDQTVASGDLASFINLEEQNSGIMREVGELRDIKEFMAASTESLEKAQKLLKAQGDLLVEMPTFWPIVGGIGRITNYFGPEVHPFTQQWYLHKGIDIAYRRGIEVVSAANGKVIERKYDPMGFGNYIVIRHSYGFATKYAHLDNVYVEEGDSVTQGQKIGTMGNTGLSTGPHLHFEVRIGSQVVDPERFLNVQTDLE